MRTLQASPSSIGKIFNSQEFVIPNFQRPYSWEIDQCEQLWFDISSFLDELIAGKDSQYSEQYFLGSIVVCQDKGNVWEVIDGQQRLTTLLILFRVLFHHVADFENLQAMYRKRDPIKGNITDELRLETKVLAGVGRNDNRDFQKIMNLDLRDWKKDNPYKTNCDVLIKNVSEWIKNKSPDEVNKALLILLEKVVMLPIICDSLMDALTLFQIINDRGMKLTDADIFKAQIYEKMEGEENQEHFIRRWTEMEHHVDLFRIHMHVVRASKRDIGKEIGLRSYIQTYFKKLDDYEHMVRSLEGYYAIRTQKTVCTDDDFANKEKVCRAILKQYPNVYWEYPLYVFLNKHGSLQEGNFLLAQDKQQEYVEFLKNTVQYFYIKGVVYNAVNNVKDTAFKVCAAIANDEDYVAHYKGNISTGDVASFYQRLNDGEYGKRYRKGILWICSWLNEKQDIADYAYVISDCELEHILPNKWIDYAGWDETSYEKNLNRLGNLVALEMPLNRSAGYEFFKNKKGRYLESKIQDVNELAGKNKWHPNDVDERHKQLITRLKKFFDEGFIK